MRDRDGGNLIGRDHNTLTNFGHAPEALCRTSRKADATMRSWITGHDARMQRHARPSDALHERHRCTAVDVGAVPSLTVDDGEYARWGAMARHAGRDLETSDLASGIVYRNMLIGERQDRKQRPVNNRFRASASSTSCAQISLVFPGVFWGERAPMHAQRAALVWRTVAKPKPGILRVDTVRREDKKASEARGGDERTFGPVTRADCVTSP